MHLKRCMGFPEENPLSDSHVSPFGLRGKAEKNYFLPFGAPLGKFSRNPFSSPFCVRNQQLKLKFSVIRASDGSVGSERLSLSGASTLNGIDRTPTPGSPSLSLPIAIPSLIGESTLCSVFIVPTVPSPFLPKFAL